MAVKKQAAEATLAALPPADIEIYTDGAAEEGYKNGGAGCVIKNNATNEVHSRHFPAGSLTSSFKAEQIALHGALRWLQQQALAESVEVRICTDSRSLVQTLQSGPSRRMDAHSREIWEMLAQIFREDHHLTLQWIPGHSNVEGNEAADTAAKQAAATTSQRDQPIDLDSAKSAIKRFVTKDWKKSISHPFYRHKTNATRRVDDPHMTIEEDRIINQMSAGGHCPLLQDYRHKIGLAESPKCLKCSGMLHILGRPDETLEHCLLKCMATKEERREHLGPNPTIQFLWEEPRKILNFLRSTGRIGTPTPPIGRQN